MARLRREKLSGACAGSSGCAVGRRGCRGGGHAGCVVGRRPQTISRSTRAGRYPQKARLRCLYGQVVSQERCSPIVNTRYLRGPFQENEPVVLVDRKDREYLARL